MSSQNSPYNYRLFHFIIFTCYNNGQYYTQEQNIKSRIIENLVFPKNCISFELYDRLSRQSDIDNTIFIGDVVNRSQYYIGKKYDLDSVAKELGTTSPIYKELKEDGATEIVRVYGNEFLGICPEDTIISPQQIKRADVYQVESIEPTSPTMSR